MGILLNFLQGIIESMGIIACSLAMLRVPLYWKRIFVLAIVMTAVIFSIRALPISYGIHMLAGIICLFFFIVKTTAASPSRAFMAVFTSVVILSVLEFSIHESFFTITGYAPDTFIDSDLLWSELGMIQAVLMNLTAILIKRFIKPYEGKWRI